MARMAQTSLEDAEFIDEAGHTDECIRQMYEQAGIRKLEQEAISAQDSLGYCPNCREEYTSSSHRLMRCPGRRKDNRRNNAYCRHTCGCHGASVAGRCNAARACNECVRLR